MSAPARLSAIVTALILAMTVPAPAQLDPLGSEFQVNTFTPGFQRDADVAADAQGNFVAVWDGPATTSPTGTVFIQRFDRNGAALGTEYEVPTGMCAPPRFGPAMCRDSAGGGVLAWSMSGVAGVGGRIFAQLFDSTGTLLGTEFQVSSQSPSSSYEGDASIACGDGGDFVVVWDGNSYGYGSKIFGRRFDSSGAPEGTEFQVNTYTSGYFFQPKVAADDDRDFVIVWTAGYAIDGGSAGVFGQRFASNGDFLGAEFQVNSYTQNSQQRGSVASNGAGDFVVAWESFGEHDGSGLGIFAQRFSSNGGFLGTEFQVNTYTPQAQIEASVASDHTGNFVIAWQGAYGQDGSGNGVFAQRFDDTGAFLGTEFQVNTYTPLVQSSPSIASDDDGNFFVVWSSNQQDGSARGVFGRRFDSDGNGVGSEFQVNTFTAGDQAAYEASGAACSGAGSCGATWQGPATTAPIDETVFLQLYDGAGDRSSPEVEIPAGSCVPGPGRPAVCRASAGDFVVAWQRYTAAYGYRRIIDGEPRAAVTPPQLDDGERTGIFVQRFDAAGNPVGSEFQVNTYTTDGQYEPDVACDDAGDFAVVWSSVNGQDGHDDGVFGQRFSSDGAFAGTEFQVNSYTAYHQNSASVAADMDGDFVVAWQSDRQDGGKLGVFGQRFSSDGNAAGTEFQINSYTGEDQRGPAVATDAAGDFVVAWESRYQDGDRKGIFAQRFSSDGNAAGTEFQVNGYTSGDQYSAAVTAAADGAFVVAWSSYRPANLQPMNPRGVPTFRGSDVFARQFDGAGAFLGTEFQVNSYTSGNQSYPALGIADDGQRLVVVWNSSAAVAFLSGEGAPSVRAPAGGAVPRPPISSGDFGQDGSLGGVFGQLYGPTDTPTVTPTTTSSATPTETPTPIGPAITGGDDPGSNEVTGTGSPNRDPGCLEVYEVGPNRVPDGGTGDDELLGSGGTDASGNFSIMLNRPLKSGDVIFIVDTCAVPPLSGPVDLITGAAPAPALSPALLALALAMLSLIALLGLRQRRQH